MVTYPRGERPWAVMGRAKPSPASTDSTQWLPAPAPSDDRQSTGQMSESPSSFQGKSALLSQRQVLWPEEGQRGEDFLSQLWSPIPPWASSSVTTWELVRNADSRDTGGPADSEPWVLRDLPASPTPRPQVRAVRRNHRKGLVKDAGPQAHPTPVKQSPRPPPVPLTVLESAPHVGMVIIPATWAPGLGSPPTQQPLCRCGGGGPFPVVRMFITGMCLCSPLVVL